MQGISIEEPWACRNYEKNVFKVLGRILLTFSFIKVNYVIDYKIYVLIAEENG